MPSLTHEALLVLFRNRPELAPELLRDALHVTVPEYSEVRLESAELTDVQPAEYRADMVILLVDGKPVLGIVVEVQLREDPRKRFTWPMYAAGLRARRECPACVLVLTPTEAMARWCRRPIDVGPGNTFAPLVIGPASVPVVDDAAMAERDPELAILSVMAHGHEAGAERLGRAALLGMLRLSDDRQVLYFDLVFAALSEAAKTALEELMTTGNYEFQSDFAKKYFAQGEAAGVAKGEAAGVAKGEAAGVAKGEAKGEAKALLAVLGARGLRVSDEVRARVLACIDSSQLATWIRKAATATSIDQVF